MRQRQTQEQIHDKGFKLTTGRPGTFEPEDNLPIDYGRIRVGLQTLDDAVLDLGSLPKANRQWGDKGTILRALAKKDYASLREISRYYYELSGIYERMCKYFAYLYRYDWFVVPYINDETAKEQKILTEFSKVLGYLDNSNIKYMCGDIALKVIINGCWYGYIVDTAEGMTFQELPVEYCRSRFKVGDSPAVEFNPKYFDDKFRTVEQRLRILKMYPEEFSKAYIAYKKGKLNTPENDGTWWLLDPSCAIKINVNGSDYPILANAIPAIIDLDLAQDLDRKKTMQKLLKVIIQKLPLDKNGDLIFDVDEAKDIHNNTVQMLKRAIGVDVMTTFADVDVADLADKNTTTSTDDLEKVERTLYNAFGVSSNLFNTDGNLALEKSSLNDEASIRCLVLEFQSLYNKVLRHKFPTNKKWNFRFFMLETTINNYQELSKMYKEHVQIGYSKMLPQIALGHSQSAIIAMAHFENEVLHLPEIMIPPLMSSTMSSQDILGQRSQNKTEKQQATSEDKSGRPEKPDSQKSEKTIQNKESMS